MPPKDDPYERVADILTRTGAGFLRTGTDVETEVLKRYLSPEQAQLAACLSEDLEPLAVIAERFGEPPERVSAKLQQLIAERSVAMLWPDANGDPYYCIRPFVVGFYESNAGLMKSDPKLAVLVEQYRMLGLSLVMDGEPTQMRAIPAQLEVKPEWILPYDQVENIIQNCKGFYVSECICRVQKAGVGKACDFTRLNCLKLSYSDHARQGFLGDDLRELTKDETIDIIRQSEKEGLVHMVAPNTVEEIVSICNCCGCCCGNLTRIREVGRKNTAYHSNYYAVIDSDRCAACGTCEKRCQVNAISYVDGEYVVAPELCIGCGVCLPTCQEESITLVTRPEKELVHPPKNIGEWTQTRVANRIKRDRLRSLLTKSKGSR